MIVDIEELVQKSHIPLFHSLTSSIGKVFFVDPPAPLNDYSNSVRILDFTDLETVFGVFYSSHQIANDALA